MQFFYCLRLCTNLSSRRSRFYLHCFLNCAWSPLPPDFSFIPKFFILYFLKVSSVLQQISICLCIKYVTLINCTQTLCTLSAFQVLLMSRIYVFSIFVKTFSVDGDHGSFLLLLELLQRSYIDITSLPKAGLMLHHKKSRHTHVIPLIKYSCSGRHRLSLKFREAAFFGFVPMASIFSYCLYL